MQSSIILALRTLVMVVSLMAIPLAAVVGTGSWPQVCTWLDGLRTETLARFTSTPAAPVEVAPLQLSGPPLAPALAEAPAMPVALAPTTDQGLVQVPLPPPLPKPPFWPGGATTAAAAPRLPAATPSAPHFDPQTTPAAYAAPQNRASAAPPVAPPPDVLGWIRHRLETLGATYYRLETAGARGEMFRFQCKMTSPTNPNYVRYFEATASEPQRAMQHVLDQVDAWMASRQASR